MTDDLDNEHPSGLRPLDRIGNLVELLTTFDRRLLQALDSLEEMKTNVGELGTLGDSGDRLAEDLRRRIEHLDVRLNRDLDDVKTAILDKLGDLDLAGLGPRFDRLEEAVTNIERATVNLDKAFAGALELMPNFMSRRLKNEMEKQEGEPDPVQPVPPVDA